MSRLHRWLIGLVCAAAVAVVGVAALIAWPDPTFERTPIVLSNESAAAMGLVFQQVYPFKPVRFAVRDGIELFTREFIGGADVIVLIHGVTADSTQMNKSAGMLSEATGATVYALDLRGHGASEGISGDVDYVGQYEDDVIDVINVLRRSAPDRRVVLGGHSMGGGIAQRVAMRRKEAADGYLLFAPLMGYGTPTMNAQTREDASDEFMRVHIARIAGLAFVNALGIRRWNDKAVLFHNLPETMRTRQYTFRAMLSMSPADFEAGATALDAQTLVLVGGNDEVFAAAEFAPLFEPNPHARVIVVPGENHNGITHNETAIEAVRVWWSTVAD